MQGSMMLIPSEKGKPRKLVYLKAPPTLEQIRVLMGGTFELVPEFETVQHHDCHAGVSECMAFCRDTFEAKLDEELPNQWGNILWGMSLARKYGPKHSDPGASIKGPVLVLTGDKEFLEAL